MKNQDCVEWLKGKGHEELIKQCSPIMKKVFSSCLKAGDQQVLVIGDIGYDDCHVAPILSAAYYIAAKGLGLQATLVFQEPKIPGEFADMQVIEELDYLKKGNIVIANMSNKLGNLGDLGKSFRRHVKGKNHKFLSAAGLRGIPTAEINKVITSMDINYDKMRQEQEKLKQMLDEGERLRITTEKGTKLTVSIKGRNAIQNDGNYGKAGTGGNIPAGEVYIPPVEDSAEGVVVVDGSSRNSWGTEMIKEPIKLKFKAGRLVAIEGGDVAEKLEKSLAMGEQRAKFPERIRVLAELGIGMNPNADVVGTTIIDEKARGTCHIAIGSNYWFGGRNRTIVHFDQVIREPVVKIDGKRLILDNLH